MSQNSALFSTYIFACVTDSWCSPFYVHNPSESPSTVPFKLNQTHAQKEVFSPPSLPLRLLCRGKLDMPNYCCQFPNQGSPFSLPTPIQTIPQYTPYHTHVHKAIFSLFEFHRGRLNTLFLHFRQNLALVWVGGVRYLLCQRDRRCRFFCDRGGAMLLCE